ncbi:hypothetical protein C8R43DRAFT_263916 [Mycena crocata]|nr:hypothetical protein C8R43DRAFT_263916 [Mycena crocata]
MFDHLPQGKSLHTIEFVSIVRNASETQRSLPIVAMDAYKVVEPTDFVIQKTKGKYAHHFILVEIGGAEPRMFARVDFQGGLPFDGHRVAHSIMLSLDRATLTPGTVSFARLANGSHGGLTVSAFASLLEIMYRRTPRYDLFSRNCLWFAECILYATGRRYAKHWRSDYIAPIGLGRYVDGSINASRATAEIYSNDEALRFFVDAGLHVVRGLQWFFSLPVGNDRIRLPDEEIGEILHEWENTKL